MGAYLSQPLTEKNSSDDSNDYIEYGASSMQGWRVSQEDAHSCILNYNENASLFAVFDGHGGAEVAEYCAKNLPMLFKDLQSFRDRDFEKALKEGFLDIDQSLLKENVLEELKRLAGERNLPENQSELTEEEEEDLASLRQEGILPLDKVLERYRVSSKNERSSNLIDSATEKNISSNLISDENTSGENMPSGSTSDRNTPSGSGLSRRSSVKQRNNRSTVDTDIPKSENGEEAQNSGIPPNETKNDESVNLSENASNEANLISNSMENLPEQSESSSNKNELSSLKFENSSNRSASSSKNSTTSLTKENGENLSKPDNSEEVQNGEVSASNTNETDNLNNLAASSSHFPNGEGDSYSSSRRRLSHRLLKSSNPVDIISDSSSEDDEDFHGISETSSTEDGEEDIRENDDEEETEYEDDEEGDDNIAVDPFIIEEPGKESGCTAVVALLHGKDLYVANAGDSRCVLCRNGQTVEMSLDHKPEDEAEKRRIRNAGGKVTTDGRVNGGLNLSRAIGDHSYKKNKDLPPENQMITALPDIRKVVITPEDEFMILACDGIWNSMSSEQGVEFVRQRINRSNTSLSEIVEELFDHCLAPHTMGDGTGCDNMTAIIVKFKPNIINLPTTLSLKDMEIDESKYRKRSLSIMNDEGENEVISEESGQCSSSKRVKTSENNEDLKETSSLLSGSSSIAPTTPKSSKEEEKVEEDSNKNAKTEPPITISSVTSTDDAKQSTSDKTKST